MKAYKLTDENNQSKNNTKWGKNVSVTATGDGKTLCSDGFIHFYTSPLIAVLMNPFHAGFKSPRLWECETSGEHIHEPLKSGCKTLTTIKEIPLPKITREQRIAFAILCAKKVSKDEAWNLWADKWLSGEDRSKESAKVAAYAYAYAYASADSSAAYSAYAYAASAYAASAAAASAAYDDASAAAVADKSIDFANLAEKAMTY